MLAYAALSSAAIAGQLGPDVRMISSPRARCTLPSPRRMRSSSSLSVKTKPFTLPVGYDLRSRHVARDDRDAVQESETKGAEPEFKDDSL